MLTCLLFADHFVDELCSNNKRNGDSPTVPYYLVVRGCMYVTLFGRRCDS